MEKPDQCLFEEDILSAEFCIGVTKGKWGLPEPDVLPSQPDWPKRILWIAAVPRANSPDWFYILLDVAGYRSVSPTGTFWDPSTRCMLDFSKRPKGRPDSRFAKVFRTDWPSPPQQGSAFYHPYDRVAAQGHTAWPGEQPHLVWTINQTIVDYLEEFHALLNSGDYIGV
ncbi:MAG: hypothetical protein ABSC54_03105 [Smithellaceae bacterium]|jgi:hypothetical protein